MKISTLFLSLFFLFVLGCKQKQDSAKTSSSTNNNNNSNKNNIAFAKGFTITDHGNYTIIEVTDPWPDSDKTLRYGLVRTGRLPDSIRVDAVVQIPIKTIVVTSTTHIPSLEMLGMENSLIGFPNLDYISSTKTRALIDAGKIAELGQNENINTEMAIDLGPDLVVGFGVEGQNKTLQSLSRAGLAVVYNGDWVEPNPLGKAEWIKFFAAFYDKQELADSIFAEIATSYKSTKALAKNAKKKPTVLSGAMFKDVWYLPNGDSWAAQLIADAHGEYLYAKNVGTGSSSLSIESVLDNAQNADFWIAPNSFESFKAMEDDNDAYSQFKAFKEMNIYGFGSRKGATGGLLYYELAPNRPDLVLKDLVKIIHPELLQNYTPAFFERLE